MPDCKTVTAEELAAMPLFAEDPDALAWLADHFETQCVEAGEILFRPGDPALHFIVVLEGAFRFTRPNDPYGEEFRMEAGEAGGVLPFSRMKVLRGLGVATAPTRLALMETRFLRELVYRAPCLAQKLVEEMTDRTREMTQIDERRNKMLALGKLSAGLAHELNNPAAALVSSSTRLREILTTRRNAALELKSDILSPEGRAIINTLAERIRECKDNDDAMELADRSQDLADWLDSQGIEVPQQIPDTLAAAGFTVADLEPARLHLNPQYMSCGLIVLSCDYQVLCLSEEIQEAARRVSDLVQAVKSYSYMDQTPLTQVRIEEGIKVTLRMFQHELKHGVQVVKNFAPDLPAIEANGSELNQIWTNLIDNAIDAMREQPEKRLEIRTRRELGSVVIEFIDNGPGIPEDVRGHIFDPFFTTKPVGQGTGLGLDIVHRIVKKHKGGIQVESVPGRTVFQVRLPI